MIDTIFMQKYHGWHFCLCLYLFICVCFLCEICDKLLMYLYLNLYFFVSLWIMWQTTDVVLLEFVFGCFLCETCDKLLMYAARSRQALPSYPSSWAINAPEMKKSSKCSVFNTKNYWTMNMNTDIIKSVGVLYVEIQLNPIQSHLGKHPWNFLQI